LLPEDLDGCSDDVVIGRRGASGVSDHLAQRAHALVHKLDAEGVDGLEMAVERRWHDAGGACHLTQADAGQTALSYQPQGDIHQGLSGALLALRPTRRADICPVHKTQSTRVHRT
jgi:hypothetical protein